MQPTLVPTDAETAAAQFVTRHQQGLWRWLRALGCEAARADEHCQDALLAALHGGIDQLPHPAAAQWLRRAGRSLFLMRLRAEKRRPSTVPLSECEATWLELGGDDDGGDRALMALDRCLQALPARDRDLVARRYERLQPRAVMAAELGIGAAAIKMGLRRVRERLRECLGRRLAGSGDARLRRQP